MEKKKNKGHENLIPAKKGEIRNPKGKPKGTKNIKTRLKELLALETPEKIQEKLKSFGLNEKVTYKDAMLIAQIKNAAVGDTRSARFIAEYTDGKPEQKIDLDTEIKVVYVDRRF